MPVFKKKVEDLKEAMGDFTDEWREGSKFGEAIKAEKFFEEAADLNASITLLLM